MNPASNDDLGGIRSLRRHDPPSIGSSKARPPSIPHSKEPNLHRPLASLPRPPNVIPTAPHVIPTAPHVIPTAPQRHSHGPPTSFPRPPTSFHRPPTSFHRPPTSFPRRRESSDLRPPCIQLKRAGYLWCCLSLGSTPPTVPRIHRVHIATPYFHFPSSSYQPISIRPSSIRRSCNSRSDSLFDFFMLHGPHSNPKFVITSRPFLSFGFLWSTCK